MLGIYWKNIEGSSKKNLIKFLDTFEIKVTKKKSKIIYSMHVETKTSRSFNSTEKLTSVNTKFNSEFSFFPQNS